MKIYLLSIGFLVLFNSCNNDDCQNDRVNDFDHFLGLSIDNSELDLMPIMGEQSYGYYVNDSSAFIYQYLKTDNAPVAVWVNSKNGNIETIFMEILGVESFDEDVDIAKDAYEMEDCETRFFGMMDTEIINILGRPSSVNKDDSDIKYIDYKSEDSKILIEFRFFKEQDYKCSSISVNWFY